MAIFNSYVKLPEGRLPLCLTCSHSHSPPPTCNQCPQPRRSAVTRSLTDPMVSATSIWGFLSHGGTPCSSSILDWDFPLYTVNYLFWGISIYGTPHIPASASTFELVMLLPVPARLIMVMWKLSFNTVRKLGSLLLVHFICIWHIYIYMIF